MSLPRRIAGAAFLLGGAVRLSEFTLSVTLTRAVEDDRKAPRKPG
jgi:hypothetical protein